MGSVPFPRRSATRCAAAFAGLGSALPARVVDNATIAARLGVDDDWVHRRTGIRVRHAASDTERLDELAAAAGTRALDDAGVGASEVDLVLVATTTAEEMSPHAAPIVAARIGTERAGALDVSCACVGLVAALTTAAAAIESGRAATVLVIGADFLTQYPDPDDPQSAMLFGDGAGAAVLRAVEGPFGIGPTELHADGSARALITLDRVERTIRMDGPAVFGHAVRMMADVTTSLCAQAEIATSEVDLFVYHQANSRIIEAVGRQLGIQGRRVVDVVSRYANTSAASIPIALAVARTDGRLAPGDTVLMAAFGAGLVWGGAVCRWGMP